MPITTGKETDEEILEVAEGFSEFKQIIRYISKTGIARDGAFSVSEIDAYVTEWLKTGYTLFNTHYLGENPEGYGVLYILVR